MLYLVRNAWSLKPRKASEVARRKMDPRFRGDDGLKSRIGKWIPAFAGMTTWITAFARMKAEYVACEEVASAWAGDVVVAVAARPSVLLMLSPRSRSE